MIDVQVKVTQFRFRDWPGFRAPQAGRKRCFVPDGHELDLDGGGVGPTAVGALQESTLYIYVNLQAVF